MDAKYSLLFRACFYGCLRISECKGILGGDLRRGPSGDVIFLRSNKRLNKDKPGEYIIPTRKVFFIKEFRAVIDIVENAFGMHKPLFNWAVETRAQELTQRAAEKFSWPKGIIWDGAHCCRHGSSMLRVQRLSEADATHNLCGAMTRATNEHYSRPNDVRKRHLEYEDNYGEEDNTRVS